MFIYFVNFGFWDILYYTCRSLTRVGLLWSTYCLVSLASIINVCVTRGSNITVNLFRNSFAKTLRRARSVQRKASRHCFRHCARKSFGNPFRNSVRNSSWISFQNDNKGPTRVRVYIYIYIR